MLFFFFSAHLAALGTKHLRASPVCRDRIRRWTTLPVSREDCAARQSSGRSTFRRSCRNQWVVRNPCSPTVQQEAIRIFYRFSIRMQLIYEVVIVMYGPESRGGVFQLLLLQKGLLNSRMGWLCANLYPLRQAALRLGERL